MAESPRPWSLEAQEEYRFELDQGEAIAIRLVSGNAEIFGSEMAPNRWYHFVSECKAALFTWDGCQLEMSNPQSEYASEETNVHQLSNLHLALEAMRIRSYRWSLTQPASNASSSSNKRQKLSASDTDAPFAWAAPEDDSPRVMILGPEGSGKTTAIKTLTNWCARTSAMSWRPVVLNLDPSEGLHSPPGALTLTPHPHPTTTTSPAHTFGSPAPVGPTPSLNSALVPVEWWFGDSNVGKPGKGKLWDSLIDEIGEVWEQRRKWDLKASAAGLLIDTPGALTNPTLGSSSEDKRAKYSYVKKIIDTFKINVLLILGHEKLNVEMQRMFGGPDSKVKVVKLPKSGGIVELDAAYRSRAQALQIRSYFYGDPASPPWLKSLDGQTAMTPFALSPHSSVLSFDTLKIYRVGEESMAPSSALPIGAARVLSETQLIHVDPSGPVQESRLLNVLLALVRVPKKASADEDSSTKKVTEPTTTVGETVDEKEVGEKVSTREICGFVVITSIDTVRKKFTVLSPTPGRLPSLIALVGNFEYVEM